MRIAENGAELDGKACGFEQDERNREHDQDNVGKRRAQPHEQTGGQVHDRSRIDVVDQNIFRERDTLGRQKPLDGHDLLLNALVVLRQGSVKTIDGRADHGTDRQ